MATITELRGERACKLERKICITIMIMKTISLAAAILFICAPSVFGQTTFVNRQYGLEMQEPKGWIVTNKAALETNLTKLDFDDAKLTRLLNDAKGTILLSAYQKYDVSTRAGLIPTIKLQVRSKQPSTFKDFQQQILRSTEGFKKIFDENERIGEPREVEISGIKSLLLTYSFVLKTNNGRELKVRSRTYAIPLNSYFFQLNFIDGQDEDCSVEFDQLVGTIKIGRDRGTR